MLLKPDAPPPKTIGVRVWPKAIPQFNVAHLETVQARARLLRGVWQPVILPSWGGASVGMHYGDADTVYRGISSVHAEELLAGLQGPEWNKVLAYSARNVCCQAAPVLSKQEG